jgi:NADPH:quinone reductase
MRKLSNISGKSLLLRVVDVHHSGEAFMKSWVVKQWCEPHQMEFLESASPAPAERQVLVKVEAAALNFLDTLIIGGKYQFKPAFPFTPGVEVAGVIEAVGEESMWKPGMRVCGNLQTGGYATHAVLDDFAVAPLPPNVGFAEGAALPIVYPTAHLCLKDAGRMKPGETVLVHAGAGGVGLAAIQLARAWGAGSIIATAGSADKLAVCKAQGADHAFNYNDGAWVEQVKAVTNGRGADIIIDMVGGSVAELSLKVMNWRARLVVVGFAGGTIPNLPANRFLLKAASAVGVFWGETAKREPETAKMVFADLFGLLSQNKIMPVVSARYPLSQAPQAMLDLAGRKTHGKVVLIPD